MSKILTIKETFEGGLKHSLYSNFKNWEEAILELLDNAVSNRIIGKKLKIEILTSPKFITIINRGGIGMGLKQLKEFLEWGKIKEREAHDLGAYSQGGKAAMGYLGGSMIVKASLLGKQVLYKFEDNNLHDYRLKNYSVQEIPFDNEEGFVEVEVRRLRRKIKNEELLSLVANRYKPLIDNSEIEVMINGSKVKANIFPLDHFRIDNFEFPLKFGNKYYNKIKGWVGRLVPRSGIKGGIRCYKLGRLICDKEYFGHPDAHYKQTLNFLFGEVYLDHVPATTNKTDFDRDSDEWKEISKIMYAVLKPHVDELLGREIQEPTDEEKERVKTAKEVVAELMKLRNKQFEGKNLIDVFDQGQKRRELKENVTNIDFPTSTQQTRKNNPRTPPPKDSVGKRRRLKEFMEWILRPMDDSIRSKIEENDGKKTLVINNLFSGFKAARGNLIYLIETAAIQLSRPDKDEKLTPEEYIEDFDELYAFFCDNIDFAKENINKKRIEKNNSIKFN